MQVTLETTSGLERRMRISVPGDELETKVAAKLKETASQARIKGFRPGKVPLREVKRRFGEGIRQEVGSEMMQNSFAEAIKQEEVSPAGMPQIEDVSLEAGKDLEFTAVFEVFPEIKLGDFSAVTVERPTAEVKPEDIDTMIETLRQQRTVHEDVERGAAEQDKVNLDYEGFVDGEAFDGGTAEAQDLIIGSNSMIPGFEAGLIGLAAGAEKDLELTFPEQYHSEDLAGKAAVFKVKINSVAEARLPELDSEFFQQFGVADGDLEDFRKEVAANMEKELKASIKSKVKNQVLDGLLSVNQLEIPQALISQEIDRLRHDAIQQFGGQAQIDPSMLPAEMFSAQAEKRVSLGLLVNAVIEQHSITAADDRVRTMIEEMASSYEDSEQVINYYYSNEQQLNQIQGLALEDQVIDFLLDSAQVTDVTLSYEEAIKPVQPPIDPETDEDLAASSEDSAAAGEGAAGEGAAGEAADDDGGKDAR